MSDGKIFISIAAYRDPELIPTIEDMIKKADNPENLVIAIGWQHAVEDTWDDLKTYNNDPRFKIIDIDYTESLGTCWARSLIQKMYNGEEYTLQLDSHHRFSKGWDTMCKKMYHDLKESGIRKPLLTAYLPSYDPENDPKDRVKEVWKLNFDRFTPEGVVFMLPALQESNTGMPTETRFLSAHFTFTSGDWIKEVPYDPNLYFHGEEISLAVRSYTSGYDLFIPNQIIAWHEYTRKGRIRHWDENKGWDEMNVKSLRRVKEILGTDGVTPNEDLGIYGLGSDRSREDYERYAGIRFRDRAVQQFTLDNYDPPNPTYLTPEKYDQSWVNVFRHCIDVYKGSIPKDVEYDFWAVIFEDEDFVSLDRYDLNPQEIEQIKSDNDGDFYNIWRTVYTDKIPHRWVVWPHVKGGDWGEKVEGSLPLL